MVNPFEETMMAGRGSPHLNPSDYTVYEPPGYNEYIDHAYISPVDSPYFLPSDSSSIDANLRPQPTQEEGIIGNIWDTIKFPRGRAADWVREKIGMPVGTGPYWPTSSEGRSNLKDWLFSKEVSSSQGLPGIQLAQSQWRKPENMEKTIEALKLRPEFEGWTDEAIKNWIYNTARASRGGIIGLL